MADAVVKVFGHIRGPFSMLLHSPRLAERLLSLVTFVREESVVEPKLRLAAVLAAARERGAPYVWAAQVEQARRNGVREEVIDLLRTRGDPGGLPAEERDVVIYTRQLMGAHRVDPAAFDALKQRHSAQWLIELTAIVSFFGFVSGIANAFEIAPPPDGDRLPE